MERGKKEQNKRETGKQGGSQDMENDKQNMKKVFKDFKSGQFLVKIFNFE